MKASAAIRLIASLAVLAAYGTVCGTWAQEPPADSPPAIPPAESAPSAEPSPEDRASPPSPPGASSEATVPEPDAAETQYLVGLELLKSGDYLAAVEELREAVRVDPHRLPTYLDLAKTYYLLGDLDQAIEVYRAASRLDPASVSAHLHLAIVFMVKRDWGAAADALDTALKLQPDLPEAYYHLGTVRYGLGDRSGAIAAYREALKHRPDQPDIHYHLGLLLKLAGEDAEAAEAFYVAALAGLPRAQYFLGSAHAAGQGVERNLTIAVQWWFRALDQHDPQADAALSQLRQTAFGKGKRTGEAKAAADAFAAYRDGLKRHYADLAAASGSVGDALIEAGRADEGLSLLIREAQALNEAAQERIETFYRQGLEGRLAPGDPRLWSVLLALADDGHPGARLVVARAYATGAGVPRDVAKAKNLLKGHPAEEAKTLLKELTAADAPPSGKSKSATRRPNAVRPR